MLWLTWRQHRLQLAIGALILGLLCAGLVATKGVMDEYAQAVATCTTPILCSEARNWLARYVETSPILGYLLPVVPLLIGIFAGAPLMAREIEQRTLGLVWTQSTTRRRWLAVKLGMLGGLTVLAMGILLGLIAWWSAPIDNAIGPWTSFEVCGIVPLSYALFALTLGIASGIVTRNTAGSMALTLVIFVLTRLIVSLGLRPQFQPPVTAIESFQPGSALRARDWVLNVYPVNQMGHPLRQYMQIVGTCDAVSRNSYAACLRDHGVYVRTVFQPAVRYWSFQEIEVAIFLALAALLIVLTCGAITRIAH